MRDKGIFRRELTAAKFRFLAGFPILLITALLVPLSYDYILDMLKTTPVPGMFAQQMEQMNNYGYYIWSQWFGKNLLQFSIILALIFGSGLISSEVSGKTIHFLLSRPVPRARVYTLKYVVNLVSLELVLLISSLVLYGAVVFTGKSYPAIQFIENQLLLSGGVAIIFSIAMYCSNLFDQSMKVFLISGLAVFLLSVPGYFEPLKGFSLFYHMKGEALINGGGFPYTAFVVMALGAGIFYKLGMGRFVSRDW